VADHKVSVAVSIEAANKTGTAAKEVERAAEKIEQAADKAGDAMDRMGRAAANAKGAVPDSLAPQGGRAQAGGGSFVDDQMRKLADNVKAMSSGALPVSSFVQEQMRKLAEDVKAAGGGVPTASVPGTAGAGQGWLGALSERVSGAVARGFGAVKDARFGYAAGRAGEKAVGPPRVSEGAIAFGEMLGRGVTAAGAGFAALSDGVKKLHGALLVASAAATGFVAAGNPMLLSTFTGSVQLLGSRISEMLIPAFLSVSGAIQRAANWIHSLDQGTKDNIASVIKWGAIVTLGTVVTVKAVGAIVAMKTALFALGPALTFISAHPIVLAIGAIAAGVGYLTYKLGLLDDVMDKISGRSSIYARPLDQTGKDVQAAINQQLGATTGANANTVSRGISGWTGMNFSWLTAPYNYLQRMIGGQEISADFHEAGNTRNLEAVIPRIEAILRQQGVSEEQIRERMNTLRSSGVQLGTEEGRARAAQIAQTGVNTEGLLTASAVQPRQYQSGTEYYNDVFMQAVGRGTVEQSLLRSIQENTQRTIEAINALNSPQNTAVTTAMNLGPAMSGTLPFGPRK
jgi:hypothetical protein